VKVASEYPQRTALLLRLARASWRSDFSSGSGRGLTPVAQTRAGCCAVARVISSATSARACGAAAWRRRFIGDGDKTRYRAGSHSRHRAAAAWRASSYAAGDRSIAGYAATRGPRSARLAARVGGGGGGTATLPYLYQRAPRSGACICRRRGVLRVARAGIERRGRRRRCIIASRLGEMRYYRRWRSLFASAPRCSW